MRIFSKTTEYAYTILRVFILSEINSPLILLFPVPDFLHAYVIVHETFF